MKRNHLLSTLWIVAVVNYFYCDLLTLMDPHILSQFLTGTVGGMQVSQQFLLASAVFMEISMSMILMSFVLPRKASRVVNVVAASVTTLVQLATLFTGTPTAYYLFFSVIETGCTVAILVLALRWKATASQTSLDASEKAASANAHMNLKGALS
jgi:hypothetical protein